MIVSASRRFVFAHVPKTGGISIRAALAPFADESLRLPAHETLAGLAARLPQTRGHFKFAFVRNPWDRLVSFYAYARRFLARTLPGLQTLSFEDMLRALDRHEDWTHDVHAFRPQSDFVRGADGAPLADFVGRFERLETDFDLACARAGIAARLTHRNASDHRPYAACYTAWSRDFVAARYRTDIEAFDYRFEDHQVSWPATGDRDRYQPGHESSWPLRSNQNPTGWPAVAGHDTVG
ncbi:MAG: sulfotransferase family 2 domain-containing protein [Rhizomicrobium sp.]